MDPQKFESLVRQLSASLSRRSLVGGSVGASVLTAVGLGDETLAKKEQVSSEACTPENRLCGCKNKKGDGKPKPWQKCRPCSTCCHNYSVKVRKKKRRCACKPHETECGNSTQCCSGVCGNGLCQPGQCAELGQACNEDGRGGIRCCDIAGAGNFASCAQTSEAPGTCTVCAASGGACNPDVFIRQCCVTEDICHPLTKTCGAEPACLSDACDPNEPDACWAGTACVPDDRCRGAPL